MEKLPDYIPPEFGVVIQGVIAREGGYSNRVNDNGGETNYGVTSDVWRANGYMGAIKDAPVQMARRIYFARYISRPGFDKVFALSSVIGDELIDTGINMGPAVAGMFFQRWLNAFNVNGRYGDDLFVDGACGAVTLRVFHKFLEHRGNAGAMVLLKALNGVQANRYLELIERRPTQREFAYGWIQGRT